MGKTYRKSKNSKGSKASYKRSKKKQYKSPKSGDGEEYSHYLRSGEGTRDFEKFSRRKK
tara:strand:- start:71 stop:247 length:177 start_codon:yes stop_codon:yes gene_type:complete